MSNCNSQVLITCTLVDPLPFAFRKRAARLRRRKHALQDSACAEIIIALLGFHTNQLEATPIHLVKNKGSERAHSSHPKNPVTMQSTEGLQVTQPQQ